VTAQRFVINPKFSYTFDAGAVLLRSERASRIITNPKLHKILQKIHGGICDEDTMVEELFDEISPAEVYFYVNELKKHGIISEPCPGMVPAEVAFWEEIEIPATGVKTVLSAFSVEITALNHTGSVAEFHEACTLAGLNIAEEGQLRIVITDDYETPELAAINADALRRKKPWMLIKPSGAIAMVGPIFLEGHTGCWQCLAQRLALNRQAAFNVRPGDGAISVTATTPSHPLLRRAAFSLAALEAVKFLQNRESCALAGRLLSLEAAGLESRFHTLVRRPQCKACGKEEASPAGRLSLLGDTAPITLDGGFRAVEPEETYERYQRHVSPITGVVQFVKHESEGDRTPVFNYLSGANIAMQNPALYMLNNHVRSFTGGKGKNHAQAKAGALCEALERYSCTSTGDDDVVHATYADLGEQAIHPCSCMLFSESQYANRDRLNEQCLKHYFLIPAEFDEHERMEWVRLENMTGEGHAYLPAAYCLYNFSRAGLAERSCYADSNGCAAGNTLEEAVLQGLMELVERDGVAIWWYNMLRRPEVDIRSFRSPYLDRLAVYHKNIGRTLYAIDLTFDLDIPCFAGISHENGKNIMVGFGAHTDPHVAMERAMVEVNQFFPTLRMEDSWADQAIKDWLRTATLDNQPYLVPAPGAKKVYEDYQLQDANGIVTSINFCLDRLRRKNMNAYYLDMTRPDIGLPVVRVVVPGLRHFWKRFAPGRLYSVPVELGLLEKEKTEDELNPTSVFF